MTWTIWFPSLFTWFFCILISNAPWNLAFLSRIHWYQTCYTCMFRVYGPMKPKLWRKSKSFEEMYFRNIEASTWKCIKQIPQASQSVMMRLVGDLHSSDVDKDKIIVTQTQYWLCPAFLPDRVMLLMGLSLYFCLI